jgi:hypothetical protein
MPSAFCNITSKSPGTSGASFILRLRKLLSRVINGYVGIFLKFYLHFFISLIEVILLATHPFSNSIRALAMGD